MHQSHAKVWLFAWREFPQQSCGQANACELNRDAGAITIAHALSTTLGGCTKATRKCGFLLGESFHNKVVGRLMPANSTVTLAEEQLACKGCDDNGVLLYTLALLR